MHFRGNPERDGVFWNIIVHKRMSPNHCMGANFDPFENNDMTSKPYALTDRNRFAINWRFFDKDVQLHSVL